MSFWSPSYFSANDCCFTCVLFHIPVTCFSSCTSFISPFYPAPVYVPIPFPPMYFLSLLYFLSLYFLCLSCTSPPKILLRMHVPGPSCNVLPCIVDFTLTCWFYFDYVCNVFFFPFCFTGIFLKNVFIDLFYYGFSSCLSFFKLGTMPVKSSTK